MLESVSMAYSDIRIGDVAEFSVALTTDMIDALGSLSGDLNPLHMNQAFAESTEFGGRVSHGMFAALWFSRLIGMYLPGRFSLYLSQDVRFHRPMLPGKEFIVHGEVTQKSDALSVITLSTRVVEVESGQVCVDGQALVKVRA